jgi:hypothetical protein
MSKVTTIPPSAPPLLAVPILEDDDGKILRGAGAWFYGDPVPANPERDARLKRAAKLIEEARNLTPPPRPQARSHVRIRGERLSKPILWQGRQWAVTGYGVEARDGCYAIKRSDLWDNDLRHGWIMHMTEKLWVDLADFTEALRVARRHHAPKCPASLGI